MSGARRRADDAGVESVDAFITALAHPMEREIRLLRATILGAAPGITEGIKWNAPSFSTSDHFATFHLRARDSVQVVLHRGVKGRPDAKLREAIEDPAAMLQWRGADRAVVVFRRDDPEARRKEFAGIVMQWVRFV